MPDALQILQAAFQNPQNRTETQRILQGLATTHAEHRDLFTRLASNQNLETLLALSGGSNIGADTFGQIARYAGGSTTLESTDLNHLELIGRIRVAPPVQNAGSQAVSLLNELIRAETPVARTGILARLQQLRNQNPAGIPLSEQQIQQLTTSLQQGNDQIFEAYRNAITAGNQVARATALDNIPVLLQRNTTIQQILGVQNPVGFQPTQQQRTQLNTWLQESNDNLFDTYRRAIVGTGQARSTALAETSAIFQRNFTIQRALEIQNPIGFRPTPLQASALLSFFEQNGNEMAEVNRRLAAATPGSQAFENAIRERGALLLTGTIIQGAMNAVGPQQANP